MLKKYGSKIIGVISYVQANGAGADIRTTGYGGVENVSESVATVAADFGLATGLTVGASNTDVAVNKDQIAVVEESAGKVRILFAGGTSISVNEPLADVEAALGV